METYYDPGGLVLDYSGNAVYSWKKLGSDKQDCKP